MTRRSVAISRGFVAGEGPPIAVETVEPSPAADVPAPVDTAIGEVLGYRWAWLRLLPVPCSLVCRAGKAPVWPPVWLRTARDAPPAPADAVSFAGLELAGLGVAAELGRAYPQTLRVWVELRRSGRLAPLTVADAMGDTANARSAWAESWTCGQVLHRLGLVLDEVRL